MNNKITFVELVDLMAEATSTTKRMCELFVRELFATVSQALIDGEQVKIKGIGTFKVTQTKPRKSVDVNTGEPIQIESHNKLSFTPDKSLAEAVNQHFAQFESVVLADEVTDEKLEAIDQQYPSPELPETVDDDAEWHDPLPKSEPDEFFVPEPIGSPVPLAVPDVEPVKPEPKPEPQQKAEPKPEPVVEAKPEPKAEPKPEPVKPEPVKPAPEPAKKPEPVKAMEAPKPAEEETFKRPTPRNAYRPTQEQIDNLGKPSPRRWLWLLLAAALVAGVVWYFMRGGDNGSEANAESDQPALATNAGSDSTTEVKENAEVAEVAQAAEPAVITDTVTAKIVLSTLSDRYYDSPWFWVYIYEENKNIISDPNNVRPGTIVVIPPAEKYGIDAKDPASLKKAQRISWEILKGK